MENYILLLAMGAGIAIAQLGNYAWNMYKLLWLREKQRDDKVNICVDEMKELFNNLEKSLSVDIDRQLNPKLMSINRQLATVLAVVGGTAHSDKGSYKTYAGLFGSNSAIAKDVLLKGEKAVVDEFKQLLEDIGSRRDIDIKTEEKIEKKSEYGILDGIPAQILNQINKTPCLPQDFRIADSTVPIPEPIDLNEQPVLVEALPKYKGLRRIPYSEDLPVERPSVIKVVPLAPAEPAPPV